MHIFPRPTPIIIELQLLQDKQAHIQNEIENTYQSANPKKNPNRYNRYSSLCKVKTAIKSLRTLQGLSCLAPASYCSENNDLAAKHCYLTSLNQQKLQEFPYPVLNNGCGESEGLPFETANIHIVNSLHNYPSLPLSFIPPTSNWGRPKWDLSYRNPKSRSDWTLYCELWEGVK